MSESTSPLEHPACALSSRILHPALRYTFIQGLHPALPCSIHPVFQALSHLLNCFSMVSADSAVFLANPSTAPCSSCHTRCTGFDVTPAFSVLLSLPAIRGFKIGEWKAAGAKDLSPLPSRQRPRLMDVCRMIVICQPATKTSQPVRRTRSPARDDRCPRRT